MITPQSQCTNLELSKKLRDLGYPQESLFYWRDTQGRNNDSLVYKDSAIDTDFYKHISAPTVAELGERLPKFSVKTYVLEKRVTLERVYVCEHTDIAFIADTEADARAKMLIYLLENKLIKL